MKVVLFCGGRGLRMREAHQSVPKPMVNIGSRPVLWHIMKYYAHHGHTDFILCLGYRAEAIKLFFLDYEEALSNDFVLSGGRHGVELLEQDISDWRITFVDTGYSSSVGERLRRVREHIGEDEYFLANYGDTLTDAPLPEIIEHTVRTGAVASFLAVRPSYTFHTIDFADDDVVEGIRNVSHSGMWVNGGYFVLNRRLFEYMNEGEELVTDVFERLIAERSLIGWRHEGFWAPMDTLKEQQELEAMVEAGAGPWRVWRNGQAVEDAAPPPPADR
jgi:glucose-1-phosphate cytidylyltransferase